VNDLQSHAELPLPFADRADAGRKLAQMFGYRQHDDAVVVGLARGGIVTAAAMALELDLCLDVVAVEQFRDPGDPDLMIDAVGPDGEAAWIKYGRLNLGGRGVILVDEAITDGSNMVAAAEWARRRGADRIVAAAPVASVRGLRRVLGVVTETACLHVVRELPSVAAWYRSFPAVDIGTASDLIATSRSDRRELVRAGVPC
jgi:predicted phosphoribosyltransferase